MELYEEHVVNISFAKIIDIDEIQTFKEIIEILHKEIGRASLMKLRFTKSQVKIIKDLHIVLKKHEAYTDKGDN